MWKSNIKTFCESKIEFQNKLLSKINLMSARNAKGFSIEVTMLSKIYLKLTAK